MKGAKIIRNLFDPKKIFALALAAVLLPACADQQDTAQTPDTTGTVTAEQVSDNTNQLIGRTVTVRSEPLEKVGLASFTISDQQFFNSEPILVVNASGQPFVIPDNIDVQVTGTVRNLVVSEIQRDYNLTLEPNVYREYENRPAIIARSIAISPSPGELTRNPNQFYGRNIAVEGDVNNITGQNTFTLDNNQLLGGENLLVLHATPPQRALNQGESVAVTGVLRPFVVAEIERDYNITWDNNVRRTLETEYSNRPVLVATEVYPSAVRQ
jgi:hypothetical protein